MLRASHKGPRNGTPFMMLPFFREIRFYRLEQVDVFIVIKVARLFSLFYAYVAPRFINKHAGKFTEQRLK